jgi:hypothetical protein
VQKGPSPACQLPGGSAPPANASRLNEKETDQHACQASQMTILPVSIVTAFKIGAVTASVRRNIQRSDQTLKESQADGATNRPFDGARDPPTRLPHGSWVGWQRRLANGKAGVFGKPQSNQLSHLIPIRTKIRIPSTTQPSPVNSAEKHWNSGTPQHTKLPHGLKGATARALTNPSFFLPAHSFLSLATKRLPASAARKYHTGEARH